MRDPFEGVSVRSRKAGLLTAAGVILLIAYGLLFPTQVAIVGVVLTLPLIIMLHEAGHFFTAKRTGMKVTEFFVGFGPRIWSIKRGETEYGVKAVLLGGYCRIIGMTNLEDVDPADEERGYRSKGYFARVLVAVAGPAVHFAIALVLMFSILMIAGDTRNEYALTTLDEVTVGAKEAGLRAGDTLVSIDGEPITDWSQVAGAVGTHRAGDEVRFVVDRNGELVTADVELTQHVFDQQTVVIAGISATIVTPQPGFFGSLQKAPGGVIAVADESLGALGQIFSPSGMSEYFSVLAGTNTDEAAEDARFLSPIGFANVARHAVDAGWLAVVGLLLVINVFVGLINLVPLLPFDGGHIAIATYEKISSLIMRRKVTVDAAKLMPVAGFVLVLLLFIFVSSVFLDITRPVSNPF